MQNMASQHSASNFLGCVHCLPSANCGILWLRRDARRRFSNFVSNDIPRLAYAIYAIFWRRRDVWCRYQCHQVGSPARNVAILMASRWKTSRRSASDLQSRVQWHPGGSPVLNMVSSCCITTIGVATFGVGFQVESRGSPAQNVASFKASRWHSLRRLASVSPTSCQWHSESQLKTWHLVAAYRRMASRCSASDYANACPLASPKWSAQKWCLVTASVFRRLVQWHAWITCGKYDLFWWRRDARNWFPNFVFNVIPRLRCPKCLWDVATAGIVTLSVGCPCRVLWHPNIHQRPICRSV
jgi:hypothetical protein